MLYRVKQYLLRGVHGCSERHDGIDVTRYGHLRSGQTKMRLNFDETSEYKKFRDN